MKLSKGYILFIVILFGIIMMLMYRMPEKFVWTPTYHHTDYQPFGAAIFDDMVEASIPGNYSVSEKTFYQLLEDSVSDQAILVVADYFHFDRVDVESLFKLLDRGNEVMLVSGSLGYLLHDTLNLQYNYNYFPVVTKRSYASRRDSKDTLLWNGDEKYAAKEFHVHPLLVESYFNKYDSLAIRLATRKIEHTVYYENIVYDDFEEAEEAEEMVEVAEAQEDEAGQEDEEIKTIRTQRPVALKYEFGRGELYVVSDPLLFTNYGMLNDGISTYIFRLLSQMQGRPLMRIQAYGGDITESRSPLRYFMSQSPLRWGIYLTLLLIVTFMTFTARRRQRVIPVIRPPENKSIEFAELIGALYFQKKNHVDLVRKRYTYFADNLRRTIQVDLDGDRDDHDHARRISLKTGIDEKKIYNLLLSLRRILGDENAYLSDDLMKKYIDRMNEIENS